MNKTALKLVILTGGGGLLGAALGWVGQCVGNS